MKVFLGWSGDISKKVALALHGWLPKVIQSVKPYISSEDIAKGARWSTEIASELQVSNYGIICITSDNFGSPWINFEGGALSREIEKSCVVPFLFDLKASELLGPLAIFQSVVNEKDDILKMLQSINDKQAVEVCLDKSVLQEAFEVWWPILRDELSEISTKTISPARPKRDIRELVEELVDRDWRTQKDLESRFEQIAINQRQFSIAQETRLLGLETIMTSIARNIESLHVKPRPVGGLREVGRGLRLKDILERERGTQGETDAVSREELGSLEDKTD